LLRQQRSISWVYDAALRVELSRRLGVTWEPVAPGAGQADLVEVPEVLREVFSQRTAQVDSKLAELVRRWIDEHDGTEPDPRTIADLQRRAVLASRPPKAPGGPDPVRLVDRWRDQARTVGIDNLADLAVSGTARQGRLGGLEPLDRAAILDEAVDRVAEGASTWLAADLAREIAALIPPGVVTDPARLVELIDDLAAEAAQRCVELHPPAPPGLAVRRDGRPVSEHVTDRHLSTTGILDQEQRLWTLGPTPTPARCPTVDDTARSCSSSGPPAPARPPRWRAAVDRLRDQGRPVLGLAPSGKAADVLARQAGCPAVTLAKLLTDTRRHPPPGHHGDPRRGRHGRAPRTSPGSSSSPR
jgi:hypothetical protein